MTFKDGTIDMSNHSVNTVQPGKQKSILARRYSWKQGMLVFSRANQMSLIVFTESSRCYQKQINEAMLIKAMFTLTGER